MSTEDWKDPEDEKIDLILENQSLEDEIASMGGTMGNTSGDVPPGVHNEFLKHVINFEKYSKRPMVPIRKFFPVEYRLPKAAEMTEDELVAKLKEIEEILADNCIGFGFANELPPAVLYTYLAEEVIPHDTAFPPEAEVGTMLDGCSGYCPECFQKDYCDAAKDYNDEEPGTGS